MPITAWAHCSWLVPLLLALVWMVEVGAKANAIRPARPGESAAVPMERTAGPTATGFRKGNSPVQVQPCGSDKECGVGSYCHAPPQGPARCAACRRRRKRCYSDGMCCPGSHCSHNICIAISESTLSSQITAPEDHNKYSTKGSIWKKTRRVKISFAKGHEGDPCLRSSDCADGYCCARHFWSKMCKPVLRQGEVCTRQRRKGSHGLELFQRCDCARNLTCAPWNDVAADSRSRLHVCQRP
ncbi:dickkopf-related protein 2-like isoform X1 [Paramormyrops kingsleyae]|uniref:Dickkopf-related protein 2-like n=1 Tax=Paramormyrops kingsleyae TaxID=1676925 RepID=A0A3B3SPV8_9TELE|nr:dickkopf-related protein 2-like isoform X1 [Paramormyrops kingsleyae]